jgi:integrase
VTITLRKRGKAFHADAGFVQMATGKTRLRGTLGTRNGDAAKRIAHRLEIALSEGRDSALWPELKTVIPHETFVRFADYTGWREKQLPTWAALRESFDVHLSQRIAVGKLQESTAARYRVTIAEFSLFLAEQRIGLLQDITKPVVESFKVWRKARILARNFSRGGTGLVLDAAVLHRVFALAVENEMIIKNPVRMEGRPGDNPTGGAEPFTGDDLARLRDKAGDDLLTFLLLRWTGFRGSDAVSLTWQEVHLDRLEIERVTQKRRKRVIIPIQTELLFALEVERDQRQPQPADRVLINPETDKPMARPRLYERMKALGKRADVADVHPHRFRDTLAVDMLSRGASPYDVAKVLGDTIETIERHYTPFVRELRERVRGILESEGGLEGKPSGFVTPVSQSSQKVM